MEKNRNEQSVTVNGVDYPVSWTFGPGGAVQVLYKSHIKTAYLQTWPKKDKDEYAKMVARELIRDVLREQATPVPDVG